MGLGKTIQTISFICAILGTGGKEDSSFNFFGGGTSKTQQAKCVLVVAPASVLYQWEREVQKVNNKYDFLVNFKFSGANYELIFFMVKREILSLEVVKQEEFKSC